MKNFTRFIKKIPANSKNNIEIKRFKNGNIQLKATSPGKVPGSKSVYEKTINLDGKTIDYTKSTYDPAGKLIHIKDKIKGTKHD